MITSSILESVRIGSLGKRMAEKEAWQIKSDYRMANGKVFHCPVQEVQKETWVF